MTYLLIVLSTLFLTGCGGSGSGGGGELVSIASTAITLYSNIGRFAGAVQSVKWMGHELVDTNDHGRLWQTALQIDGYGECYNPTEAGAASDKNSSSSKLLAHAVEADDGILATQVQAAYWVLNPAAHNFCPKGKAPGAASQPSDTIIEKRIQVGALGDPSLIEWRVGVKMPSVTSHAGIEILTGYMPAEFTRAFSFSGGKLVEIGRWDDVSATYGAPAVMAMGYDAQKPVVLCKADGSCAVALWRPKGTIRQCESHAYHLHKFSGEAPCAKFSVVSHASVQCFGEEPSFVVYAAVGSLATVLDTLKRRAL